MNHHKKEAGDDLARLLSEKILVFKNFLLLTESLKGMLERENMEQVKALILKRRHHINRIDRLDSRIRKLRERIPGCRKGFPPAMEKRLQSLYRDVEGITKSAIQSNGDCAALASGRVESIRDDLVRIRHEKQGFKGYRGKRFRHPVSSTCAPERA